MEKSLVIYYSYSGKTRVIAKKKAEETGADICEVKEVKKRSGVGTFFSGCPAAIKRKKSEIKPIETDMSAYDTIVILAPVWAGHPAPAFNNVVDLLPGGKNVEIIMTSGGGNSAKSAQGTKDMVEAKQCKVVAYQDIRTAK